MVKHVVYRVSLIRQSFGNNYPTLFSTHLYTIGINKLYGTNEDSDRFIACMRKLIADHQHPYI